MGTFGQFITSLAAKAGVSSDHKGLIDILSNAELAKITVPEDLENSLNEGLTLTIESAKNNLELKKHFRASILNGVDAEIKRIADENEFDEDSKLQLNSEDLTTSRKVRLVTAKIKALQEKKAEANTKDKPELQEKINALLKEKADAVKTFEDEKKAILAQHEEDLTSYGKRNILAAKKYAASHLDTDTNISLAELLLSKELQAKGAKIVRRDGQLRLVQAGDPSLDYYNGSTQPTVEQFIDGVLAQNKLLAVSEPTPPVGIPGTPNGQPTNSPGNPGAAPKTNHSEVYDQALADYEKGSHAPQAVPA